MRIVIRIRRWMEKAPPQGASHLLESNLPTSARSKKRSFMRPLLQFLLLGTLIFAGDRWLLDRDEDPEPTLIEISSDQLAVIRRTALASSGRLPDEAELRALVDAETAEEMLYREALALGVTPPPAKPGASR